MILLDTPCVLCDVAVPVQAALHIQNSPGPYHLRCYEIRDNLRPFTTDGCSGFMSFLWRQVLCSAPPWEGACLKHDKAYWRGGDTYLRLAADTQLMRDVAANGHPYWAVIMFIGVRLGGPWWLPFPSVRRVDNRWTFAFSGVRWGYGFKYPRYR
jgi:hypothetical protein